MPTTRREPRSPPSSENRKPYRAVPWFWSDQGDLRLQMVGLMPAQGVRYRRDGAMPHSFSILHYVGERLSCVESVNAPMDHLAARKLLETGRSVPPESRLRPRGPSEAAIVVSRAGEVSARNSTSGMGSALKSAAPSRHV